MICLTAVLFSCNKKENCPDITLIGQPNCPEDTTWVCGCDKVSYINECVANNNGMYVVSQGKCTN